MNRTGRCMLQLVMNFIRPGGEHRWDAQKEGKLRRFLSAQAEREREEDGGARAGSAWAGGGQDLRAPDKERDWPRDVFINRFSAREIFNRQNQPAAQESGPRYGCK